MKFTKDESFFKICGSKIEHCPENVDFSIFFTNYSLLFFNIGGILYQKNRIKR